MPTTRAPSGYALESAGVLCRSRGVNLVLEASQIPAILASRPHKTRTRQQWIYGDRTPSHHCDIKSAGGIGSPLIHTSD